VDSKSGYVIFEHVAAYEGVFSFGGSAGVDMGIGEFEFFIRDRAMGDDVFRATQVKQRFIDPIDENKAYSGRVLFTDLDTGVEYVSSAAVWGREIAWPDGRMQNDAGRIRCELVEHFHVDVRDQVPADFNYILDPLTRVFQASVKTGNPVRWC
jgi:hypothetical protein